VIDTNVIVAAYRSRNPHSPTIELIERWRAGQFTLIYSRQIRREYISQLSGLELETDQVDDFADDVLRLGVRISLRSEQIKPVTSDPKDNVFVACALVGNATQLVTYDPHIRKLGSDYRGLQIVDALQFLYLVRGDQPSP
jgi:hypothetical protein